MLDERGAFGEAGFAENIQIQQPTGLDVTPHSATRPRGKFHLAAGMKLA